MADRVAPRRAMRWTALSFDLDGTLVDTADEIATAANRAIAEFGFAAQPIAAITPLIGAGGHELVRRLLARLAQTPGTAAALQAPHAPDAPHASAAASAAPHAPHAPHAPVALAGAVAPVAPVAPAELLEQVAAPNAAARGRLRERVAPAELLEQVAARFKHHYAAIAGASAKPYPGCAETLQRLRDAGVRLACVTNKDSREARLTLQAVRLDGCFELLVGGDTLPQKKPRREVLEHALQALGAERSGFAHVGDSAVDVAAARNAGVAAWAVPWGYNGGEPVAAARPDRLFGTLAAIADHVLAENSVRR